MIAQDLLLNAFNSKLFFLNWICQRECNDRSVFFPLNIFSLETILFAITSSPCLFLSIYARHICCFYCFISFRFFYIYMTFFDFFRIHELSRNFSLLQTKFTLSHWQRSLDTKKRIKQVLLAYPWMTNCNCCIVWKRETQWKLPGTVLNSWPALIL